jgi:Do/DeqQ family serine protease
MNAVAAAVFGVLCVLLSGCSRGGETGGDRGPGAAAGVEQYFVKAVDRAVPAVVNIRAVTAYPRGRTSVPRSDRRRTEDQFGGAFDDGGGGRENSLGSGVLIAEDGLIVTNEHVVRDADEIIIRLWNRTEYPARIVGADPRTDVALLRIQPKTKVPVAVLGDSSRLRVGEWAIAVGNPFGLESTVTLGVISATGRTELGTEDMEDFIQTDASINPGNSGGPLLNTRGEVVGINTAMVSAGQGIGFAIPINTVMAVERELARSGVVRRGWLGVGIQALGPELAESFGVKGEKGILINNVVPNSPADRGGLRGGDIVTAFGGKPVAGLKEFQKMIAGAAPGSRVSLDILRGGRRAGVTVAVGEMDGPESRPKPRKAPVDALGLSVASLPARVLKELEIGGGVEVRYADASGPAWEGGIREGDVLLRINRSPVNGLQAYAKAVAGIPRGQMVSVLILRDGARMYVAFRLR